MAYQEFTSLDKREWLEYYNFSAVDHSDGTGWFGRWIRATGTGYTDETFLRFDISDLLFATITNVDLEITCNSKGSQTGSQTGYIRQQDKSDIRGDGGSWYNTGFDFDTPFAISAWNTTLASKTGMLNTGTYTFLNTTAFKDHVQKWVDQIGGRPANNWGLIVAINFGAIGYYLSLDSAKLKITYTPASPARTLWGVRSAGHRTFDQTDCRMMGGTSPNPTNILKVKEVSIYVGSLHTSQVRVAIYQGGTLDSPVGASLVQDLGVTAGSLTNRWLVKGGWDITLAKNTVTWLAFKCNDGGFRTHYTGVSSKSGDTQSARGRWSSTGMSADENASFESTIPSGGSFNDWWYPIIIHYIEESATTGVVLRRRREMIQPF